MTRRAAAIAIFGLLVLASTGMAATINVPAGGNLQQALNQAQPGDTIVLAAGATYTGNFVLPAKNGSSYITIRSSAPDSSLPAAGQRITPSYASQLPKLQSPAGAGGTPPLATAPSASYYIIQFIEFLPNSSGTGSLLALGSAESTQNSLSVVPHHITVDRCYLHSSPGVPQLRGIALNSASTTIRDSYISEMKYAGLDSQAIAGWNGPGPYTIVNNYMQAAGENFMLGGSTMYIPNTTPTNIEFRNNYLTKDPSWRGSSWTVKNIFELKHAQDVVVDGNTFEYIWLAAQPGYAIVLTPRNQYKDNPWTVVQRVTFTNNLIRHVSSAFNVLGWDNESAGQNIQTNHLTFRNNVLEDVSSTNWGGDGRVMLISQTPYVTFDHNTAFNGSGSSALYAYNGPSDYFTFTNNILSVANYGIMGDAAGGTANGVIAKYFANGTFAGNVMVQCASTSMYPAGNNYPASYSAVGFVNLSGGDYHLASTSAYKGTATDRTDPGANIDALQSALASSTPAPQPPPATAPAPTPTPTPAPGSALPSPWTDGDIGSSAPAGSASASNGTFTVQGGGTDIWGSADSFNYAYQPLNGDGQIVARVASLTNTNAYAKAGVMIRETLTAGSKQVTVNVKPGGGVEFLSRIATNGSTTCVGSTGSAPLWVKVVRSGGTITGYFSTDGNTWTQAGTSTVSMATAVYVGLAVTSHNTSTVTTGTFDNITVSAGSTSAPAPTPTPTAPSSGLTDSDVGSVTLAGSASVSNGVYTVKGAGADVWGTADAFNFDYQPLAGDGQVVARVTSLTNTNSYAKAGVMIRATLAANAVNVLLNVRPGGGIELLARTATGSSTLLAASATGSAPVWLKLVRSGSTFTGYSSADGAVWTTVGTATVSMATTAYAGLAVCSHNTTALSTGTFDNLAIGAPTTTTTTTGVAYTDGDIGSVGLQGSATFSNGVYTIKGAGADIWGTSDSFNFAYVAPGATTQTIVHVTSVQNTNGTAKAGIMFRDSLAANAATVVLDVTPSGGIELLARGATGGGMTYVAGSSLKAPVWLKLVRSGSTFTAYTSADGTTWTAVGNTTVSMAGNAYSGLVVCSHNTAALNTSTFDNWSVK